MISKIGDIKFKEIKRISPSQFYSMKNCAYKSLLAASFDKKPLLPLSLSAYFGTVLHKILELIEKGIVRTENEFNEQFDTAVKILERDLEESGYYFYVPLKMKLRNFGLRKIQLKKYLRSESDQTKRNSTSKYLSEKWYESKDKTIGGFIDLVVENDNHIEIYDFKTGSIKQDSLDDESDLLTEIKAEYKEQLKLYAYLYFENTNKYPSKLYLVDLSKKKYIIDFTHQECRSIYESAKYLLKKINESIQTKLYSANPSEANCKYCLYRPACSFYHTNHDDNIFKNDVYGEVENILKFKNGNLSLVLKDRGKRLTIKNFRADKFELLNNIRNRKIRIYNLRKEVDENIYSVTDTTMIYE